MHYTQHCPAELSSQLPASMLVVEIDRAIVCRNVDLLGLQPSRPGCELHLENVVGD